MTREGAPCAQSDLPRDIGSGSGSVRVVVVDDHALSRRQLVEALMRRPLLRVVGEAENGADGLALIERLEPDVALLDVRLPGLDGFSVARRLREQGGPPTVLISAFESPRYIEAAKEVGAADLVAKSDSEDRLAAAVLAAAGRAMEVDA